MSMPLFVSIVENRGSFWTIQIKFFSIYHLLFLIDEKEKWKEFA
jgi:hypothetical protein